MSQPTAKMIAAMRMLDRYGHVPSTVAPATFHALTRNGYVVREGYPETLTGPLVLTEAGKAAIA